MRDLNLPMHPVDAWSILRRRILRSVLHLCDASSETTVGLLLEAPSGPILIFIFQ
jgi:hypothetical protein